MFNVNIKCLFSFSLVLCGFMHVSNITCGYICSPSPSDLAAYWELYGMKEKQEGILNNNHAELQVTNASQPISLLEIMCV